MQDPRRALRRAKIHVCMHVYMFTSITRPQRVRVSVCWTRVFMRVPKRARDWERLLMTRPCPQRPAVDDRHGSLTTGYLSSHWEKSVIFLLGPWPDFLPAAYRLVILVAVTALLCKTSNASRDCPFRQSLNLWDIGGAVRGATLERVRVFPRASSPDRRAVMGAAPFVRF